MRHCCQVPDRRHAHLVSVRFGCAVAYDIVPKGTSSRFDSTIGFSRRPFWIWLKLSSNLTRLRHLGQALSDDVDTLLDVVYWQHTPCKGIACFCYRYFKLKLAIDIIRFFLSHIIIYAACSENRPSHP